MLLQALLATAIAAPRATVTTVDPAPVIDGVMDEHAWTLAEPVDDFLRFTPSPGGPPDSRTEVRFLQDETTLYVGIRISDAHYPIRARVSPREAINADDQVGIYLDPFGDAQSGYIFYFNALGIQQDIRFNAGEWNPSWSAVYRSRGRVTDDGFELEVAFPFRSLKYDRAPGPQTWGVMLTRKIPGEGAKYAWPVLDRAEPRLFTQAAALEGVRPPRAGSGLELIPGITGRVESVRKTVDDTPVWSDLDPWHDVIRPSLDVRMGVGSNMALVGAINPDFSQIESDTTPVVLNARFAFSFPERRPFFTEGGGFFDDRPNTLYSRSIVQPLYGLKLAGSQGQWGIGVLHAVDRDPGRSVHEDGTPGFATEDVDGRWTTNTLVRIRRDLADAGWFGVTLADKRVVAFKRDEDREAPLGGNDLLGADLSLPVGERWTLRAGHAQTLTATGDGLLAGADSGVSIQRPDGDGFGFIAGAGFISDGYRREMGFLTQSGYGAANARVSWTHATPGVVSTWMPALAASMFEEVEGESYRVIALSNNVVLDGVHRLTLTGRVDERREGAPDLQRVAGWDLSFAYNGQVGAALELRPSASIGRGMDFSTLKGALTTSARLDTTLRPLKSVRLDLLTRWTQFAPEEGDISQDILFRGRLQWQFTRELGLRIVSEYNHRTTEAPRLVSSALATWLLNPFTAAHIGYAERTQLGVDAGTLDRSVFAKVQILFRP